MCPRALEFFLGHSLPVGGAEGSRVACYQKLWVTKNVIVDGKRRQKEGKEGGEEDGTFILRVEERWISFSDCLRYFSKDTLPHDKCTNYGQKGGSTSWKDKGSPWGSCTKSIKSALIIAFWALQDIFLPWKFFILYYFVVISTKCTAGFIMSPSAGENWVMNLGHHLKPNWIDLKKKKSNQNLIYLLMY